MPVLIPPDAEPDLTGEELVLDSTTVDASNTPLALENPDGGIKVIEQDYGEPDRNLITAGSVDTIGDPAVWRKTGNRKVTIKVRCYGSETIMRARIAELTRKVGKLQQPTPGDPSITGTLKRTLNNGDVILFDVLDAMVEVPADWQFLHVNNVECTLSLTCKPLGRGPTEETAVSFSETSLPEAVFTVTDVKGDVPALGRLVIEDDSGNDQWFVHWGCQPPNTYPGTATANTTAALGYQAEAMTALNGATATALSGASGGTALKLADVGSSYQAIVGTDLSGTALTHVGNYRVWARLMAGAGSGTAHAGTVDVRLEWRPSAAGKYAANEATTILPEQGGQIVYRDLGMVRVPKVSSGVQQWDGRIVARSTTATDDVWVDRVFLVPVDAGYGEGRMVAPSGETPAQYVARDEFTTGTATLAGSVLTTGGTWSVTGGGTFTMASGSAVNNGTAHSYSGTSFALAGTTEYDAVHVEAHVTPGGLLYGSTAAAGIMARYVGTADYVGAILHTTSSAYTWRAYKVVGGTVSTLGQYITTPTSFVETNAGTLGLDIDRQGRWAMVYNTATLASGQDSDMATGGTLDAGRVGLLDSAGGTTSIIARGPRAWDNLLAWQPEFDAAVFGSRQAQITSTAATHQDSSGSAIAPIADYQGTYLRVPAEGMEGGTARFFVRPCRNLPDTMSDPGIDDISGTVYYTPLYWAIPE